MQRRYFEEGKIGKKLFLILSLVSNLWRHKMKRTFYWIFIVNCLLVFCPHIHCWYCYLSWNSPHSDYRECIATSYKNSYLDLTIFFLSGVMSDDTLDIPGQCCSEGWPCWAMQAWFMVQPIHKRTVWAHGYDSNLILCSKATAV